MLEIRSLPNGIKVVLEEMNDLRSVSFGVWIKVGSAYETEQNNGISHMVEHMFFKGTSNRTAKQIAEDTVRIGGNMNAYTSKECTTFYLTTLDKYLGQSIELVGDMLCHSLFQEDDIEKEKSVIIEEIDMYEDSAEDMVHEMIQKKVWGNHPLGYLISGEKNVVEGYTRDQLIQYVEEYYVAENMVISIAGNFKAEETMKILEQHFGTIPKRKTIHILTKPKYHCCIYQQKKDIEQIHMNLVFEGISRQSEEKYAFMIANTYLGGSENSRLFQTIREDLGLTYSIFSYGSFYEKAGLLHIDAALNPKKLKKVYDEILGVIEELKHNGIPESEFIQIKEQMKTELIIDNESSKSRMEHNGRYLLYYGSILSIDDIMKRISKVSNEEILTFIRTHFNKEALSISLVGHIKDISLKDF